jgi:hypothetical protein
MPEIVRDHMLNFVEEDMYTDWFYEEQPFSGFSLESRWYGAV